MGWSVEARGKKSKVYKNDRKTRDEYLSHHVSHPYVTLAYFGFEIGERKMFARLGPQC
jgi:hypothetical protein